MQVSKQKLLLHFKSLEKHMERAFWGDNIKPDYATNLFLLQKMKKEISDGNLACVASVSNLVIARKLEREQKLG